MAPGRSYDVILGLGYWCGAAHNIRQVFRTAAAFPLDWWVVHYGSLVRLLERDFANLFDPAQLEVRQEMEGVLCRQYGTLHPHDFARDGAGQILRDLAPQAAGVRQKFAHLVARMDRAVAGRSVLCVREWLREWPEEVVEEPTALLRAERLHALLAARWPTASVDLLVVDGAASPRAFDHEAPTGRVLFDTLGAAPEPGHWRPQAWRALFERHGVALRARAA